MNRKSINDFSEAVDFKNVYNWFKKKLTVVFPKSKYTGLNFIGDDNEMSETFNSFLNVFQTGIHNVTSEEIDLESFDIPKQIKEDLTKNVEKQNRLFLKLTELHIP